jgi:drug/metabolite transporter (DMT)-like permease
MIKFPRMLRDIHPEDRLPLAWMFLIYTVILLMFVSMGGCSYTIKQGGPSQTTTTQQKAS